jgi:hypothetical protein
MALTLAEIFCIHEFYNERIYRKFTENGYSNLLNR